jgi:hypothetical protein
MWCNRWLTLGGRFTLVKSVLEGQPVYWMALVAIPVSILEKIRKLMFNFLWSGEEGKKHYHLCSWEIIAKPKHLGGWGIRNLFLFNSALAENSLWRVLMKDGIWHKVIKDKYIQHSSIVTWLRSASTTTPAASQTWKNLLKDLHLLTHWLSWKPGSGHSIIIGMDSILGLGSSSFLSGQLLAELNRNNVIYLFQALGAWRPGVLSEHWKTSEDLGLEGDSSSGMGCFQQGIVWSGSSITGTRRYTPMDWRGQFHSLNVKNIYLGSRKKEMVECYRGMEKRLVEVGFSTKIKLFIWLSSENKILTWDSLQKKGWQGPNRCPLCFKDVETVYHIFVSCRFCREVWLRINKELKYLVVWEGNTLNDCLENWVKREVVYKMLPAIICWYVWLERNNVIFEGRIPSSFFVVCKVKETLPYWATFEEVLPSNTSESESFSPTVSWFDGAADLNDHRCGAGG